MITVKISEILNSTDVLQKLSKKDFKAKLSWAIARLLKSIDKEIQEFNETRLSLVQKYGEKDENGNLITDDNGNAKLEPSSISEFSTQLNELLDTSVEINANKINVDLLEDIDFTPTEVALLEPYIDFGEEE